MKYITSQLLGASTSTSSKLCFSRSARPRRSEAAPIDIEEDDFAELIDCRLISPVSILIADRVSAASQLMMRVGFKIEIPMEAELLWIRFQAKVSGQRVPKNQPEIIEILSFFPERVNQDVVFGGRIIENDEGTLERQQVALEEAGTSAARFKPFSLGYRMEPSHVIWDFLPVDGRPPTSTDKLVLTVKPGEHSKFHLSQSLQVCATHPEYGIVNFEYPTETELVKGA